MRKRETKTDGRRRVSKTTDGRLADYSSLRTATGIVIPEVRRVLLDRVKQDDEVTKRRAAKIYPSEMAKTDWCARATYNRMSGKEVPPTKSSFTLENVFNEGNMIHNKWQEWMSSTGKLWGDWRCNRCAEYVKDSIRPDNQAFGPCVGTSWVQISSEVPVTGAAFPHDWKYKEVTLRSISLPISGHADGALIEHNVLVELKSLGIGSLRFEAPQLLKNNTHESKTTGKKIIDVEGLWKDFHRPLSSHVRQGNIYLWMCRELGLPFESISIVYEFKANQQAKEFVVPYSQDIMNPLLDKAKMIVDCVESGNAPICNSGEGGCTQCRPYERNNGSKWAV